MTIPEARPDDAGWRGNEALRRHELLAAGAVAGLVAGLAMMAVAILAAAWHGVAPLRPLELVGETFIGPGALGGAAKVAFGAVLHALLSAALGVVFAAVAPREYGPAAAMGLGLGFALFAMALMTSVVVPWVNPGFREGAQALGGSFVVAYAVFGVVLGLAPALRRRLSREAAEPRAGRSGPQEAVPVTGKPRTT